MILNHIKTNVFIILNLALIIIEALILVLIHEGIIRSHYGLEVTIDTTFYIAILAIQSLFLYLTSKADNSNKRSLAISQLLIFIIVYLFLFSELNLFP